MKEKIINIENYCEDSKAAVRSLREDYLEAKMSEEQLNRLKYRMEEAKLESHKERRKVRAARFAATAAGLVLAFVALPNMSPTIAHAMEQMPVIGRLVQVVTFRDYTYEDDQHQAQLHIPEIIIDEQLQDVLLQSALEDTTKDINADIQRISDELLEEFTKYVREEAGYKELIIKNEVVTTTQEYFTLKLSCYEGEASGYERNYFYTIDLISGKRLQLSDIFEEGADYFTPINENIKAQMRDQMSKGKNVVYWLDDEVEELNFNGITEEPNFYINKNDNVVICFSEGDVAPMYMGIVEFEIPAEVLEGIRE